jgi:alanine racemase
LRSASKIEIDLAALSHNLQQVRIRHKNILAVVKADAYGHGAVEVVRALTQTEDSGVVMLGVAYLDEAISLRSAGITLPILLMTGCPADQIPEIVHHRITPVLFDAQSLTLLGRYLETHRQTMNVHIKVDTGMGRLGVSVSDAPDLIRKAVQYGLHVGGLLTHLADADLQDLSFAREQCSIFESLRSLLARDGLPIRYCHLANSAAIMRLDALGAADLNLVRPGLMLYGYASADDHRALHPVMRVQTRVLAIRNLSAGTPISYGRTYTTSRESRIAVTSIGYADGYPRALSNEGIMLAGGCRVPVVGRVCMDMTMIDVTDAPSLQVGDWVTVIGAEEDAFIGADELARLSGTIPYDILCGLGSRILRHYVSPSPGHPPVRP